MEINPFKTTISFKQYLEVVKPKTQGLGVCSCQYNLILKPPIIEYFEDYYNIIGYHSNDFNNIITCVLVNNSPSNFKIMYIDANIIDIEVEVVLKEELKDIKTVEQTKLFDNEQGKD